MIPTFEVAQGSFARPTETGVYTHTGLAFRPKVLLINGCFRSADGDAADSRYMLGMAAQDGTGAYMSETLVDGSAYYASALSTSSTLYPNIYISYVNVGGSYFNETSAYLVQFTDDGFILEFTTVDGNAPLIFFTVFGGEAITASNVGSFAPQTSTGTQNVTVGFAPDVVLGFMTGPTIAGAYQNIQLSTSFGVTELNGGVVSNSVAVAAQGDAVPSNTRRHLRAGVFIHELSPATESIIRLGTYAGIIGTGFRVSHTIVTTGTSNYCYLAIRGIWGRTQSVLAPTSGALPVSQSTIGIPFRPQFLMTQGVVRQTGPAVQTSLRHFHGWGISNASQSAIFQGSTDNQNPVIQREALDQTRIILDYDEGASGVTVNARASLTSLDTAGFTLSWDTINTTAYAHEYFVLSSKPLYTTPILYGKSANWQVATTTWDFEGGEEGWTINSGMWEEGSGVDGSQAIGNSCFSSGKGCTTTLDMEWYGTFEGLGVPAGSTVDWVHGGSPSGLESGFDAKGQGSGGTAVISWLNLYDDVGNLLQEIVPSQTVTSTYNRYALPTEEGLVSLALPSNTSIILGLRMVATCPRGSLGGANVYADNVTVNVKYHNPLSALYTVDANGNVQHV